MARKLRGCFAGRLVEVTTRTLQGCFLRRPSRLTNQIVTGVIARAQKRTGMKIVGPGAMSNHMHLLLVPEITKQLKRARRGSHILGKAWVVQWFLEFRSQTLGRSPIGGKGGSARTFN